MAVDAAVDHEGGTDDGGIAAAAREVARQQRDLEGARSLEDRHLPGRAFARRGNPRQLALETRLALVDDIAVPARLHEGDAPGVEKLVGNAGTAVAHAWILPKRLHVIMRQGAWPPPGTPAGRARHCRR